MPYNLSPLSVVMEQVPNTHRLNMVLDLQSVFWLHVHSCTDWLRPRNPRIWARIGGPYCISQPR
jgi:hypothetical protein